MSRDQVMTPTVMAVLGTEYKDHIQLSISIIEQMSSTDLSFNLVLCFTITKPFSLTAN